MREKRRDLYGLMSGKGRVSDEVFGEESDNAGVIIDIRIGIFAGPRVPAVVRSPVSVRLPDGMAELGCFRADLPEYQSFLGAGWRNDDAIERKSQTDLCEVFGIEDRFYLFCHAYPSMLRGP